jgi:putative transposase
MGMWAATETARRAGTGFRRAFSYHNFQGQRAQACGRHGLRIIEFSIQGNHIHLIVEADDSDALSRGMQGLCIRMAKALNRLMDRSGPIDRFSSAGLAPERREVVLSRPVGWLLRVGWRRAGR